MWLALDIGNSAVKGGFFDGPHLRHTFRLDPPAGQDDARSRWDETLSAALEGKAVDRLGIVSVVPKSTAHIQRVLRKRTGREAELFDAGSARLPFALAYETPATLGADRLAAAAAAWTLHRPPSGGPVVAVDAGTAVTYEVIDGNGRYRGGAIGAGPRLLSRALHQGTAQLPEVPLSPPQRAIGRSTQEALQAGVMYGFVDSVRGMLHRITAELGPPPRVVVTGGWGALLYEHLPAIGRVDAHLVLRGIRMLMALGDDAADEA